MVQMQLFTTEREDKIVKRLQKEWGTNKNETINRIIREFRKEVV